MLSSASSTRMFDNLGVVTGRIINWLSLVVVLKVCCRGTLTPSRGPDGVATASMIASYNADCLTGFVT